MQDLNRKLAKQNAVLNQILTTYVAEDVAKEILANPEERLKLGGATRLVSVLFADIRNYTGLAKSKDASLIVQFLNRIFERLVPIIFDERGTLDKFMGGAVMAFYGAPISLTKIRSVRFERHSGCRKPCTRSERKMKAWQKSPLGRASTRAMPWSATSVLSRS